MCVPQLKKISEINFHFKPKGKNLDVALPWIRAHNILYVRGIYKACDVRSEAGNAIRVTALELMELQVGRCREETNRARKQFGREFRESLLAFLLPFNLLTLSIHFVIRTECFLIERNQLRLLKAVGEIHVSIRQFLLHFRYREL